MFRLIASDLDGTLLRTDKTISKETEALLSRLGEKGILFVPSTGRAHRELPESVQRIAHLRYAVTCNGGGVYDFLEQRYLFNFTIGTETAVHLLEYCRSLPVYPSFVCDGARYVIAGADGTVPDYVVKKSSPGIVDRASKCPDLITAAKSLKSGMQKIFLYSREAELTPVILSDLRHAFPSLFITTSTPIFIEINAAGIDKGKTLACLCEHLNIPLEETAAFGDAGNDLEMLKTAGYAVVPENGTDAAKAAADTVCESNNDDGVRKALLRFAEEGKLPKLY